ncbi:MAG TPA: phosphatase PAP2 family protein [Acidimicrobiales bacterium]|nr:phosphatase PAP2 family protein [Acidimicrobiales bacterium]
MTASRDVGAPGTAPGLGPVVATTAPDVRSTGARRRRRRPTGAPPPLPRSLGTTGRAWLIVLAVLVGWVLVLLASPAARRFTDQADAAVLRQVARARTAWLTDVATAYDRVATGWTLTAVAVVVLVGQIAFRRWRHLFTFLASILVIELVGLELYNAFSRPRPYDVTTIGRWAGFSSPSPPVVVLAAVLVAAIYSLVPAGAARWRAKLAVAAVLGMFGAARLYLGVDHPFDVVAGIGIGIAVPLAGFRLFTPNEFVPVTYRAGKTAHLDVTGARGEAIRRAVHDQLGLTVLDMAPVGLAGSGGSTPLRLRVGGDPEHTYLFAKLFAMNHVRADRWYKLGRQILYGRLEDETRFQNVRRLVEYEDYALRLLRDAGIPTATSYGIVEITPEREYMLVTTFIDGAREIGEVDVDDAVIDEALEIVRRLWDAGLAHRDIKPANLLVRDGRVFLIDAFFVQVRPSPWRQAVDLGNMMLVLAVRSDAERVYQRALRRFTADDVAEAFAATRGVASPTQLRAVMKRDGRDLISQFRRLAPERPRIALQRWSVRRVGLAVAVATGLVLAAVQAVSMFTPAHDLPVSVQPDCGTGRLMVLMAQAVPSATQVPCVASLPAGWQLGGAHVERDDATFWLDSDLGGERAVTVRLVPPDECDVSDAMPVPSDEVATERYERPERLRPGLRSRRYYVFPGGCVTYEIALDAGADPNLVFSAEQALAFEPRTTLVEHVRDTAGLELCGAGTECTG